VSENFTPVLAERSSEMSDRAPLTNCQPVSLSELVLLKHEMRSQLATRIDAY